MRSQQIGNLNNKRAFYIAISPSNPLSCTKDICVLTKKQARALARAMLCVNDKIMDFTPIIFFAWKKDKDIMPLAVDCGLLRQNRFNLQFVSVQFPKSLFTEEVPDDAFLAKIEAANTVGHVEYYALIATTKTV
jgi:hypothetical protein